MKLDKQTMVTSCKSCLYRIGSHWDGLNTTQAMKNSIKLLIIPHPNRPRIIFPSSSTHGHVQIWIRKRWSRHTNHVSIASVVIEMDWIRRRLWRTVSNFQLYLTRIAHESFFRHPLYTWSRPNLNKKMVVTSCKSGLYRIGIHTDGLHATQAMKNSVKLSIIPHLNQPRIIFSSSSIHGHV